MIGQFFDSSSMRNNAVFVTKPGMVPIRKWTEIVVSVDRSRDAIYAWIDGVAQNLTCYGSVSPEYRISQDIRPPFGVGTLAGDPRRAPLRLESIRMSDTLVLGRGYPPVASNVLILRGEALTSDSILEWKDGVFQQVVDGNSMLIGRNGSHLEGGYFWKPDIPPGVLGREIVCAMLQIYDTQDGVEGAFDAHEVFVDWTAPGWGVPAAPLAGWLDGRHASADITVRGWEAEGGSGVVHFEITSLFQKWASDPLTNHGILIRQAPGIRDQGRRFVGRASKDSRWKPALYLYYR